MKKILYTLIILFGAFVVKAQTPALTVPSSPAFSILNFEPSAVLRPTNVKSLSTDLLHSFDKSGQLQLNAGLEFSPYWLNSKPNLTLQKFLKPNFTNTVLQSLSISAATIKDSVTGLNSLGTGFRFKLYNGEPVIDIPTASDIKSLKLQSSVATIINGFAKTNLFDNKEDAIRSIVESMKKKNIDKTIIEKLQSLANSIIDEFENSPKDVQSFLTKLEDLWISNYKQLQEQVSNMLYQRKGFIAEIAGAGKFNNNLNNNLEKIGLWLNLSYIVSSNDQITFTARHLFTNGDTSFSALDAILSYLKQANKFSIAFETAVRSYRSVIPDFNINNQAIKRIEQKITYRFALQSSIALNELISLNFSIGKDFDSPTIQKKGFFSILGMNYSIFNKAVEKLR